MYPINSFKNNGLSFFKGKKELVKPETKETPNAQSKAIPAPAAQTASIRDVLAMYNQPLVNLPSTTEKFEDVYNEMLQNIPDKTTTLEEKESKLKYIDRMLACDDIPDENKKEWSFNKIILEAEIVAIKNENAPDNENFDDIMKELDEFVKDYQSKKPEEFDSAEDRISYYTRYHYTCISFYERALNAVDIAPEQKQYCFDHLNNHRADLNNQKSDLNCLNHEKGGKTESFQEVYNEFIQFVPDITSTIPEKKLAISYINRMLSCDDIPEHLSNYWQNKRDVIEMEIINIENQNQTGMNEKVADINQEFINFINNFFEVKDYDLSADDIKENRITYYQTYLSFCERFLACTDIEETERADFLKMMADAQKIMEDIFNR